MCNITERLTGTGDHKALSLRVGEGFSVQLEELAGAGYVWQSHMEPDGVLQLENSSRSQQDGAAMGAASLRTMTFCAQATGTANVVLEMRRPWEKSGAATQSMRVQVTVKK